ncbi:iron ABC transporter permease [Agromyces sp. LHK192]|uniref:FecCD family ABC transporter permease n=1 Tax=Agromyces sp. LHK192 TaxID=2498704 RepID=UPI00196AD1D5|nr:iron ABC transporter permease [Agromyces sp. LHK192]
MRPNRGGGQTSVGEDVVDEPRGPLGARRAVLFTALSVGVVVVAIVSAGVGQLALSPAEVLDALLRPLGIDLGTDPPPNAEAALWTIRLPRVAMALLVGAALAAAGLLMQAVFGNPLAEPAVVGVSSGAALGAAGAIVLGWTAFGGWTTAVAAFATGLVTTLVVYVSSRAGGRTEVVTLVLTGIAVNAVAQAGLALFVFLGDTQSREEIVFWQLGSLNGSLWAEVGVVLPIVAVTSIAAAFLTRNLDLLSLGERSARHLGVNVELLRAGTIVLVALLVSAAVAFTGIIGFVGIVIPHLMRMVIGPAHGPLLVASLLGGALLLSVADLAARTLVPYADLPIGMLTALVGGPFFFWLLRRTRAKAGGWG